MAHYVTSLTFGEVLDNKNLPGNFNPLARRDRSQADPAESHDYTMKIVPTIYEDSAGTTLLSYQYTYAYSVKSQKLQFKTVVNPYHYLFHLARITFHFLSEVVLQLPFGFATI